MPKWHRIVRWICLVEARRHRSDSVARNLPPDVNIHADN